ncbi:MAG: sensor histidine kinase, partial [Acidimicrobiia bacterium]
AGWWAVPPGSLPSPVPLNGDCPRIKAGAASADSTGVMNPFKRAKTETASSSGWRRVITVGGISVLAIGLVAVAVVFANAASAKRVAENASLLHWSNATQGSAALARSASTQAILFGLISETGLTSDDGLATAIDEADGTREIYVQWANNLPSELAVLVPGISESLRDLADALAATNELVHAGELDEAATLRTHALDPAYSAASGDLQTAQAVIERQIQENQTGSNITSQMTQLLVTLLIPAIAVVGYWVVARRQMRDERIAMDSRLDAEHQMIAGVSHELRTPLTAIYGFSEALLDGNMREADEAQDYLAVINSEAADLSRMVDDLLVTAQVGVKDVSMTTLEFEPCAEIASVVVPFQRTGNAITVECQSGAVVADNGRFRQVVRNLVSNAVRHGGSEIVVIGEFDDDTFRCAVADDGDGVPGEIEDRLFQPFVNSGAAALVSGSVGLGLSVSRLIATRMGGDLTYHRNTELTMFSLSIPVGDVGGGPTVSPERDEGANILDELAMGEPDGELEETSEHTSTEVPVRKETPAVRVTFAESDR